MSETATALTAGTWVLDPKHTTIGFAVKHMGIATVRGEFTEFEGTIVIGADRSEIEARGTVKVESVYTREEDRDAHLRSADFFDAEKFPEITFESTTIEAVDTDELRVTGLLTIHGVTNEVVLDVEIGGGETDPWGHQRIGLEASGRISRGDFGMKFNQALGTGNMLVGDTVKLSLDIAAVKQDQQEDQ